MSRKLHDSKSDFRNRNILAFCLFVMLGILTIACVTKTVILNGNTIENQIVSYNVTSAFRQDLIDYTSDTFIKNGLNTSNIDDIITQNRAEDIIKSFSAGQFKSKVGYTSASSKQEIDELMNKIKAEIIIKIIFKTFSFVSIGKGFSAVRISCSKGVSAEIYSLEIT